MKIALFDLHDQTYTFLYVLPMETIKISLKFLCFDFNSKILYVNHSKVHMYKVHIGKVHISQVHVIIN